MRTAKYFGKDLKEQTDKILEAHKISLKIHEEIDHKQEEHMIHQIENSSAMILLSIFIQAWKSPKLYVHSVNVDNNLYIVILIIISFHTQDKYKEAGGVIDREECQTLRP